MTTTDQLSRPRPPTRRAHGEYTVEPETGDVYVYTGRGRKQQPTSQVEIAPGVIIDYDDTLNMLGVEILVQRPPVPELPNIVAARDTLAVMRAFTAKRIRDTTTCGNCTIYETWIKAGPASALWSDYHGDPADYLQHAHPEHTGCYYGEQAARIVEDPFPIGDGVPHLCPVTVCENPECAVDGDHCHRADDADARHVYGRCEDAEAEVRRLKAELRASQEARAKHKSEASSLRDTLNALKTGPRDTTEFTTVARLVARLLAMPQDAVVVVPESQETNYYSHAVIVGSGWYRPACTEFYDDPQPEEGDEEKPFTRHLGDVRAVAVR